MKLFNRIKRLGYATSLSEAIRLNENDCDLQKIYVQINSTPLKSTFFYRFTAKCHNPYRTGLGSDSSVSILYDDGFKSIDIALGEITDQILTCKEKYTDMTTVFCYLETYAFFKVFNYLNKKWEVISWSDFVDQYGE
jgi:hypothetical protein